MGKSYKKTPVAKYSSKETKKRDSRKVRRTEIVNNHCYYKKLVVQEDWYYDYEKRKYLSLAYYKAISDSKLNAYYNNALKYDPRIRTEYGRRKPDYFNGDIQNWKKTFKRK